MRKLLATVSKANGGYTKSFACATCDKNGGDTWWGCPIGGKTLLCYLKTIKQKFSFFVNAFWGV